MSNTISKFNEIASFLKGKKVIVAFSGGLDSTVLLTLAMEYAKETIAVFISSPFISHSEKEEAIDFIKANNIPHRILKANILDYPQVRVNDKDRCYYCKKAIFSLIKASFRDEGYDIIIEGSNSSDLSDYRPGLKALKELEIQSPYIMFNISKSEIREYARQLKLKVAEKLSNSCLATRIPYGEKITKERLERIDKGEEIIREMFRPRQLRLRDHGNIARIEVLPEDIQLFVDNEKRTELVQKLKKLGYNFITLDLQGYKTGSMNVFIRKEENENANN